MLVLKNIILLHLGKIMDAIKMTDDKKRPFHFAVTDAYPMLPTSVLIQLLNNWTDSVTTKRGYYNCSLPANQKEKRHYPSSHII